MNSLLDDELEDEERVLRCLSLIQDIRGCVGSDWSEGTVRGIEEFINRAGFVTERQLNALENIFSKCDERGRD